MNERLIEIRKHLIELAKSGDTIFYSDLSDLLNLGYDFRNDKEAGAKFGGELEIISKYEIKKNRPLLTIIVVSKKIDDHYRVHLPSTRFYTNTKRFKKYKSDFQTKNKLEIFKEQSTILFDFWSNATNYEKYKGFK